MGDLVARLVAYLDEHAPPGQLATYRGGQLPAGATHLYPDPDVTVDALLATVPDHQVAELVDLAARAQHAGLLAHLAGARPGRDRRAGVRRALARRRPPRSCRGITTVTADAQLRTSSRPPMTAINGRTTNRGR